MQLDSAGREKVSLVIFTFLLSIAEVKDLSYVPLAAG